MKIFLTEKQLSKLVESSTNGLESLSKEDLKKTEFFLSILNTELKKEYPVIDEINFHQERIDNFTRRFVLPPNKGRIRYVLYFVIYTKKNLNFVEGLDWDELNETIEKKVKVLLSGIFPKQFSQIVSDGQLYVHLTYYESNPD